MISADVALVYLLMSPDCPLVELKSWKSLEAHFNEEGRNFNLKELFSKDPERFNKFSHLLQSGDEQILIDFSKNLVTEETLNLLLSLAKEARVEEARDSMFAGFPINNSEGRAVLHTALRAKNGPIPVRSVLGQVIEADVLPAVKQELAVMARITESIHSGQWTGFNGGAITDIVNVGIGGSDLGPAMVYEALKASQQTPLRFHFVSNVDGGHMAATLAHLRPESTLFIIVSKTFTTAETMRNAQTAREWILKAAKRDSAAVAKHFIAVSTNLKAVSEFGIDAAKNVVKFWDWVGGRYSLWSGVGLSIMLAQGVEGFSQLLEGASVVDEHFKAAQLHENVPVLMALMGVWYGNFWGAETHAVLPYEQSLSRFSAYLQQADMESNGKSCDRNGNLIKNYSTGPIVWGEPGTNGQHAFFQLIHQGTRMIPCDFLAGVKSPWKAPEHHQMLLANFLAQTEALMLGKDAEQVKAEHSNFIPSETISLPALLPQKLFPGNRPSTSFLYDCLTSKTLGMLIALYEHKIFVQGVIWRLNSFDQWGVELGKQLANKILKDLKEPEVAAHDQSTFELLNYIKSRNQH